MKTILATASLAALLASGCADGPTCDGATLRDRVESASAGDTVEIGACTVRLERTLRVPAGVTLKGEDERTSLIEGLGRGPVVILDTRAAGTTLRALNIASHSTTPAVFMAAGNGEPTLDSVRIDVARGVGLASQDLDSATMTRVTVTGPMTLASAGLLSPTVTQQETATHGLVFKRVGRGGGVAVLEDVELTGFARTAALFVDSNVVVRRGNVRVNAGSGLVFSGGTGTVEDTTISDTVPTGNGNGLAPPFGVAVLDDADVEGARLDVSDTDGYGVLVDAAEMTLVSSRIASNEEGGLFAQDAIGVELTGEGSAIEGNGAGGIVALDTRSLVVDSTRIAGTEPRHRAGEDGDFEMADGIQVVGERTHEVQLRDVVIADNDRIGLLLDLRALPEDGPRPLGGSTPPDITLDNVTIDGAADALGARFEGGPTGWDDGVTRTAALEGNDADLDDTLPRQIAAIQSPSTNVDITVPGEEMPPEDAGEDTAPPQDTGTEDAGGDAGPDVGPVDAADGSEPIDAGEDVPATCVPETCNGADDDCDGRFDETFPERDMPCGIDTGECSMGLHVCESGLLRCTGVGRAGEQCNGKDDDCDGPIDEGAELLSDPMNCGMCGFVCPGAPHAIPDCSSGTCSFQCDPGYDNINGMVGDGCENANGTEVCNNIDDDANTFIDDAVASNKCGIETGACARGMTMCIGGATMCVGGTGPTEEICDDIDNDCDGVVDVPGCFL